MWADVEEMLNATDAALVEALRLGYLSICVDYQQEAMNKIAALQGQLTQHLDDSVSRNDEVSANIAWILNCFAQGVYESLAMWVHLKEGQMDSAWDALVAAQECLSTALKLRYAEGLFQLNRRLHAAEIVLFPPCKFISSSIVYKTSDCSICQQEYGECCHVAGRLYMGEMCYAVVRDIMNVDHIAIVDDPKDKRLRFPTIVNGTDRCSLTHRERASQSE